MRTGNDVKDKSPLVAPLETRKLLCKAVLFTAAALHTKQFPGSLQIY
jgi:hypothetical protein